MTIWERGGGGMELAQCSLAGLLLSRVICCWRRWTQYVFAVAALHKNPIRNTLATSLTTTLLVPNAYTISGPPNSRIELHKFTGDLWNMKPGCSNESASPQAENGARLPQSTIRKSYVLYQLAPLLMTLSDLEESLRRFRCLLIYFWARLTDGHSNLYIKIGRFVYLTGSVSECRTGGIPNDCIDNHVTLPSDG